MDNIRIGNAATPVCAERHQRFPKPWVACSSQAGVTQRSKNERKPNNHAEFIAAAVAAGASEIGARLLERDVIAAGRLSGNAGVDMAVAGFMSGMAGGAR